jgi:hypothetical protein
MEIKRAGTQPSTKRPSDWFTGAVRIDPLSQAPDPAFVQGASVTFEPGARTAWHTHPLGQTLIVTGGAGNRGAVPQVNLAVERFGTTKRNGRRCTRSRVMILLYRICSLAKRHLRTSNDSQERICPQRRTI